MGSKVEVSELSKADKKELKKHAATIHCANTLTLLQRKITNALLYHAYKELLIKEEHQITVKQLCRLIGYQGNNHAAIREAFRGLISTIIEWNLIDDVTGSENWTASSIIASVSLEGPLCYYAYSPRMKQLLHSPSMFGKIDLVIQSKFRSSYGLALYENCIRYRGLPSTKWFEINLFKKLMGVPDGVYEIFRDFKRRVLDKAIEEVNMYSDLFVEPDMIKERKKVERIRFLLKDRAKRRRLGIQTKKTTEDQNILLSIKLKETFKLRKNQINFVIASYAPDYIQKKIELIEHSKSFQEKSIKSLPAYFLSFLKNDFQEGSTSSKVLLMREKVNPEESELKQIAEEVQRAYKKYRERTIMSVFYALNEKERNRLMARFYLFAEDTIAVVLKLQRKKYHQGNILTSPQISALLRQFLLREIKVMPLLSIEEFVINQKAEWRQAWQKLKALHPCDPIFHLAE